MKTRFYATAFFVLSALVAAAKPVSAQTSQEIRDGKSVVFESHIGLNGAGYGLGINLPDDARLDISYTGNDSTISPYNTSSAHKMEYQSFLGNSFYLAAGASHRKYQLGEYYRNGSYRPDPFLEITSVHAHLSIGNEWSFDKLFLGAEWFGVSKPLQYTTYLKYPIDANENDRMLLDRYSEEMAKLTVYTGPNFYVGIAF